jgi:hypothetical protein
MPEYFWMSATFDRDVIYLADILAAVMGVSRSELLRRALDDYLTRNLSEREIQISETAKNLVEVET